MGVRLSGGGDALATKCRKITPEITNSSINDLGPLYTRSQVKKLGANFYQFWVVFGPKGCTWASQIWWYPFFILGTNTRPWSLAFISNLGQIEKICPISDLTPSVKPWGLFSTQECLIWIEHWPWLLM